MKLRCLVLALLPLCSVAHAGSEFGGVEMVLLGAEPVKLRVSAMEPDAMVQVDRGSNAGVEEGDVVLFFPLGGGAIEGTVVSLSDRSAMVELHDETVVLQNGTIGEALIPKARIATWGDNVKEGPSHAAWDFTDEDWDPDMPLLAQVEAVAPEERAMQFSGRVYFMTDYTDNSEYDRSDVYARTGVDLLYENPFRRGGALHIDGEINFRKTNLPDSGGEDDTRLRLDRFSYYWGGDRFSSKRWQVGRFLQHGMPEFGVVDGAEYGQRLDNGDEFGVSAGFMPEPSADFDTGSDFQVAAFYRKMFGEEKDLTVEGGIQKTWHNSQSDRDLFVAKVRYLPRSGWNFYGSAWMDLYGSEDVAKGDGVELTQLIATAGYRWESGNGINVTYSRMLFPELLRNEFTAITLAQLADNRTDRVSISGWRKLGSDVRLRGRIDSWDDQNSSGGGGEVGVDIDDVFVDRSRASVALFATEGRFSSVLGSRLRYSKYTRTGSWNVSYEIANHEQDGFTGTLEELVQQKVRGSYDHRTAAGWNWSVYAENRFGDEQGSLSVGVFVQKSF